MPVKVREGEAALNVVYTKSGSQILLQRACYCLCKVAMKFLLRMFQNTFVSENLDENSCVNKNQTFIIFLNFILNLF